MSKNNPICETQLFLPSLEEYIYYLAQIFEKKILTNSESFNQRNSNVPYVDISDSVILLFVNGAIAMIGAFFRHSGLPAK